MSAAQRTPPFDESRLAARSAELFATQLRGAQAATDRMFIALLLAQWPVAIGVASWLSPLTWKGGHSSVHPHVWLAALLGGALTIGGLILTRTAARRPVLSRCGIAAAQVMYSALFIHLTGGRIETHFHVFGSLAFIGAYRDCRPLLVASGVVAADHLIRGVWFPRSVFGTDIASHWRWIEHAWWVLFEDAFLIYVIRRSVREMREIASQRARLEETNAIVEAEVEARTRDLRASERRIRALATHAPVGMFETDAEGRCVFVNRAWIDITGMSPEQSLGRWWHDAVHGDDRARVAEQWRETVRDTGEYGAECRVADREGKGVWVCVGAVALRDDEGLPAGYLGTVTDITQRKRMEDELRFGAFHDRLTGLPNRAQVSQRLTRAISRAHAEARFRFALLYLDFDGFKQINDTMGHQAGDTFLAMAAERIADQARAVERTPGRAALAARLAGDEFVLLLEGIDGQDEAMGAAHALCEALARPFVVKGSTISSGASIGVAMNAPEHALPDDVLRDADMAMYQRKMHGRRGVTAFAPSMRDEALSRARLEKDLRGAIEQEQFSLLFRPVVSLESRGAVAFESIAQWRHPRRGAIAPGEYQAMADETGLSAAVGRWALREAARHARQWQTWMPDAEGARVTVAISSGHAQSPDLMADVDRALRETGLQAQRLALEISEDAVMRDVEGFTRIFGALRERGVRVWMGRFGAGRSALACLRSLPIEAIKIDPSFTSGLTADRRTSAVLHAIITLAGNLDVRVVADGVDTPEALASVLAMDCHLGQGNLLARAMTPEEIPAWVVRASAPIVRAA